jgi:hypothetical protein
MTEKLTPEEIKKALECCVGVSPNCDDCPANKYNAGECFDLVKLQASATIDCQQAEIYRLTINMNAFGLGMKQEKERADQIKSEAIKEFAERLKNEKHICLPPDGYPIDENDWVIYEADIDNLVKETMGK